MVKFLDITLKNSVGEISLGKYKDYRIEEITGLESTNRDINIDSNYRADGGKVRYRKLRERDIGIKAEFKGVDSTDERQKLIKMFNSKEPLQLIAYRGQITRTIECEIDSFKFETENIYEPLEISLDLVGADPYLTDENDKLVDIVTWTGGFTFPLKLPFKLRQRGTTKINILNEGHIETPVKIRFKGPAVNPKILNSTTGDYIRVNKTLTSDDTLIINTAFGNKTVEIEKADGTIENAFNYIDLSSTFFSLNVGDNIIEYSCDSLEPSGVQIFYRNKYYGI